MFNLGKDKIKAFGLEITESSVKAMMLEESKGGFEPLAYGNQEIPAVLFANHLITDEDKLAEYVKRLIKATKITHSYVVTSIPDIKSFVRIVKIPKMDEADIESAIPWELEQDIPVPIDLVYMDWQVVDVAETEMRVLVTATPKDYIDSLINVLKAAKLTPVAVELESQAIVRSALGKQKMEESALIVDISTNYSTLILCGKNATLEYSSNIAVGGKAITDSIASTLGVTPAEAEKLKIEGGILKETKRGNIKQATLPLLDTLVDEIKNVIKYHDEHSLFRLPLNKVILTGGASKLPGLTDYVSARLRVGSLKPVDQVVLGNPWINVYPTSETEKLVQGVNSQEYTTVIGLALRGVSL